MLSTLLAAVLALSRPRLERKQQLQAAQFLQRHLLLPRRSLLAWAAPAEQSTWCRPSSIYVMSHLLSAALAIWQIVQTQDAC